MNKFLFYLALVFVGYYVGKVGLASLISPKIFEISNEIKQGIEGRIKDKSEQELIPSDNSVPVYADNFNLNFVQNSSMLPIEDDMVMDNPKEFSKFATIYNNLADMCFSAKQVQCIKEVIISDSHAFGDGEIGLCSTVNNHDSYILIASRNSYHKSSFIHECCHAIYFDNLELFNRDFRDRWNQIDMYVSEYAKTNIEEDFAETGAAFFVGTEDLDDSNQKLKLFSEFINKTR